MLIAIFNYSYMNSTFDAPKEFYLIIKKLLHVCSCVCVCECFVDTQKQSERKECSNINCKLGANDVLEMCSSSSI